MSDSCNTIRPLLSAFHDGELSKETASGVSEHLRSCSQCQEELQSFRRISDGMKATAEITPPSAIWERIEREMVPSEQKVVTAASLETGSSEHRLKRTRSPIGLLTLAASVLLLVGAGIWFIIQADSDAGRLAQHSSIAGHDSQMSAEHMAEFVRVMDQYLDKLPEDPEGAERLLLDKYRGERVDEGRAVELVGYRPIVSRGLPDGYSLASTSVLRMPCCTCVKAVCRRADGSTLVLFEHDDDDVTWFGDRSMRTATCGDKECCLVDLDESFAATWKQGSRSVTAVGVRDEQEIAKLVDWMQESRSDG